MIWMMFSDTGHAGNDPPPANARILLVEDDFLIGLSIKTMLEHIGCTVVGPISSLEKAMQTLDAESVDAAVLDINIIGGTSVPLAKRLQQQHRPFFFVTGYHSPNHLLPEMLRDIRRLTKPVDQHTLTMALREVMN